jgi:hypothetical protein
VARRTFKIRLLHVEAEGFDVFGFDQVARMGGFFMALKVFS